MKTKTKTVGKTTDAGKDQVEFREIKDRVVLALSTEQAEELNKGIKNLRKHMNEKELGFFEKISKRIEKTLNKQSIIRNLAKTGPVTKELVKKAMEVAK